MDKPPPTRRKMHTYTLVALLALFVVAAVVALASRLLPSGFSQLVMRKLRRSGEDGTGQP